MKTPTDQRYLFVDTLEEAIKECFVKLLIFYSCFEDRQPCGHVRKGEKSRGNSLSESIVAGK